MRRTILSISLIGQISLGLILIGCGGQQATSTPEPAPQKPGVERLESADLG